MASFKSGLAVGPATFHGMPGNNAVDGFTLNFGCSALCSLWHVEGVAIASSFATPPVSVVISINVRVGRQKGTFNKSLRYLSLSRVS
jgi:hypothetical protein